MTETAFDPGFDESRPEAWLPTFAAAVGATGDVLAAAFNAEPGWWDWAVDLEIAGRADTTLYAGVEAREDELGNIVVRGRLSSLHRQRGEHHDYGDFKTHVVTETGLRGAAPTTTVEVLAALASLAR